MTYAVKYQSMKTGVKKDNRNHAPRCRVALGNLFCVFPKPHVQSCFGNNKSLNPRPLLTPSDRQVGILRQSKIFLSGALP